MILTERALNPQEYMECLTGKTYIFEENTISEIFERIEMLSKNNDITESWDYALSEIEHAISNTDSALVLVELTGDDLNSKWTTILRWFEVPNPEEFKERYNRLEQQ